MSLPIYVLGHASRSGLILPHLSRVSHTLYVNPDWSYEGVSMSPLYEGKCPLTHYRVYRGWQQMAHAFLQTGAPAGLFFEDDAVPRFSNWLERCQTYADWLVKNDHRFQLMYLCGRCFDPKRFAKDAFYFDAPIYSLKPNAVYPDPSGFGGLNHVFGCCAALMTRSGAKLMTSLPWIGVPGDVHFPDNIPFCFVSHTDSAFVHDSSQGSLIDSTVPQKYL
jgi:hypothetical protein